MMHMYSNNVRLSKKIAIGTIVSGLIFLAAFYYTYNISYAFGGVFFGLGIAAIVITILTSALIAASGQNHDGKQKSTTIIWNAITLFVLAIFTLIGYNLMNSAKIVVKNNLDTEVKNIFITGCQNFEIETINANSTKSILVSYAKNINDKCEIGIRYTTPNSMEDEILITSVKPFSGEKIIYEIN